MATLVYVIGLFFCLAGVSAALGSKKHALEVSPCILDRDIKVMVAFLAFGSLLLVVGLHFSKGQP